MMTLLGNVSHHNESCFIKKHFSFPFVVGKQLSIFLCLTNAPDKMYCWFTSTLSSRNKGSTFKITDSLSQVYVNYLSLKPVNSF